MYSKMFKRKLFVVGLIGTLGMLSFIVGVWNGINITPKRRPDALGYHNLNEIQNNDIGYELPNRNSRGMSEGLIKVFVRNSRLML